MPFKLSISISFMSAGDFRDGRLKGKKKQSALSSRFQGLSRRHHPSAAVLGHSDARTEQVLRACSDTAAAHLPPVSSITTRQLRQETSAVLNEVERGQSFEVTRKGKVIGRIEPAGKSDACPGKQSWGRSGKRRS